MNSDRLLKLAAGLRKNADNAKGMKFDLWTWGVFPLSQNEPDITCNTQGCAVGFAAISGIFKEEGFSYEILDDTVGSEKIIMPTFKDELGWRAISQFFDITEDEAARLFSVYSYEDFGPVAGAEAERNVAQRIEEFVAAGG